MGLALGAAIPFAGRMPGGVIPAAFAMTPDAFVLFYNCIACHSTAIIQQQRLNRRVWNDILLCMKDDMGWPEPAAEAYDLILDSLVANFGQDSPR